MNQLKVILKQFQKYHFWLLCVVAIIAGMVGSMMAARSLSAVYAQEKQKIEAKFNALTGILGTNPYPNSRWKEGVEKLNGQERTNVGKAWELVYDEQKSLLSWPPQLEKDFLDFVADHPPNAEIPMRFCERYQNYVKNEFPRLLKIVDAAPSESAKQPGADAAVARAVGGVGAAAANPSQENHEYRVTWDSTNQGEVRDTLDFRATLDRGQVPSSAEVRRAQEDLWVYAALLTIIKNVNDEHQFTTPVKEISQIAIGKAAADSFEASLTSEHIIRPKLAAASAAATTAAAPAAAPPTEPADPTAVKPVDEGRYVDENGKKLHAGATADSEFKRMPIFLRLKIDQREIPRFLVECANSPLPVEVRQLRINPSKGATTSTSSPQPGGAKGGAGLESASDDLPIELHGIIYIYNKPNMAKLGGEPAIAPGGPPAQPVAPAPPAG
ncbi:MAG: hypothetical protein HY288_07240 [Planctomycetia bacterium]|nr:hypothetical protein [Planctomycetia bacterium]